MTRIFALFLAAVLSMSLTSDALGLDHCPHHGVPEGAQTADAAPMAGMHHESHDAPAGDTHRAGHGDTQSHGVCTCMGACAVAAAVPVPSAPEINAAITHAPEAPIIVAVRAPRASHQLDLLPYGIAPPSTHSLG
jgi:hypothetical protein